MTGLTLKTMTTMKKYISMAVAAIAVLSSCSNEENLLEPEAPAVNTTYPTFTATIEGVSTRTVLGEGNKVQWVDGDEVMLIFGTNPFDLTMLKYKATPNTVATTATLTPSESANNEVGPLAVAVYPASLVTESQDDDWPYFVTFPAFQQYTGEGTIPFAPMVYTNPALTTSPLPSTLTFKNVASLLKITVPSTQMTSVKSITVSSDKKMHGLIETSRDNSYIYINKEGYDTPENCQLTLDCGEGVAIPEGESKTFYISILPLFEGINEDACGESYGYLQIDVTDGTNTKSMRTTKAGGIQIERNKIYPITFKENIAVWENKLTLGKETATSIVIEKGVDVSSYTKDETHKPLNAAGTLWEFLDGQVLRIQTSADKILGHDSFDDSNYDIGLFNSYEKVESITGLSNLDMSQVTNMTGMFFNCLALTTLDVSSFDTHNVTDMSYMFKFCPKLASIIFGTNFTTQSVTTMEGMFSDCFVLSTLDVSNFDTSNVTDMREMFSYCYVLSTLDVSNFDTSSVLDMDCMFDRCKKMASLTLSSKFMLASSNYNMFNQLADELAQGATCVIYNAPDDIQTLIDTNASDWQIDGKITFDTKQSED